MFLLLVEAQKVFEFVRALNHFIVLFEYNFHFVKKKKRIFNT